MSVIYQISQDPTKPNHAHEAFMFMAEKHELSEIVYLGSSVLRELATRYLPKSPIEPQKVYEERIKNSIIIPFYKRTIDQIVNKTFEFGINATGWGDNEYNWLVDINRKGLDYNTFFRNFYRNAWIYGLSHVIVLFPPTDRVLSIEEMRRKEYYPYVREIKPTRLIDWKLDYDENYKYSLTHIAYFINDKPDSDIIHLTLEDGQLIMRRFRKTDQNYTLTKEQPVIGFDGKPLPKIPLYTFYTNYLDSMVATPPLEELAYINIQHFRSYSYQTSLVDFIRTPLLLATGFDMSEEIENESISPTRREFRLNMNDIIITQNDKADIRFVEHNGQAVNSGLQHLQYLEEAAIKASNDILNTNRRSGNITATEVMIDSGKVLSTIQQAANTFDKLLKNIISAYSFYVDPTKFQIGELSLKVSSLNDEQELKTINELHDKGIIDDRKFLELLVKMNKLPEELLNDQ